MIVLIVAMAISTVKAQDTLRINSLRVVDLCSGDKSWLISLSLGTINFSDSLESFDISIGYDRSIIRPTAVLKEGTLSAQMSNGPVLNMVVPNEMRIYGFNIARAVAGSLPLFAVSGDYLGSCVTLGELTLPVEPDFNGEFKRRYTVRRYDSVKTILNRKADNTSGSEFDTESGEITENDSTTSFKVKLKNLDKSVNAVYKLLIDVNRISDSSRLRIVSLTPSKCDLSDISLKASGTTARVTGLSSGDADVTVVVRRVSMETVGSVRLTTRVEDVSPCSCALPSLTDTIDVKIDRPNVNVSTSTDDSACTISLRSGEVQGMCDHPGMKKLELQDLMGRVVQQIETDNYQVVMSTSNLSSGMYFVTLKCDKVHTEKLILK